LGNEEEKMRIHKLIVSLDEEYKDEGSKLVYS
jgi:hypothetical protein